MYHPYFRGKQYELITVRETAQILSASHFVPIIEPVKESLGGLERTLKAVCDANGQAIVIINPHHGVHSEDGQSISTMVKDSFCDNPKIMVGILLGEDMLIEDVKAYCDEHDGQEVALIHAGFTDANGLVGKLGGKIGDMRHIFF